MEPQRTPRRPPYPFSARHLGPQDLTEPLLFFFFQAEDGIRDLTVTGVQTCALPISPISVSTPTTAPPFSIMRDTVPCFTSRFCTCSKMAFIRNWYAFLSH